MFPQPHRRLLLAVLFSALLSVRAAAQERPPDPAPELAEAIAKLKTWRRSFATLRVTWKWANPGQLIERMPDLHDDEAKLASWYQVYELVWTDSQLARLTTQSFEHGRLAKWNISARNAKLQFSAEFVGDDRFPHELWARPAGPGTKWHFYESQAMHKVYNYNNTWLTDLFDRYPPVSAGVEVIGGSRCAGYRVIPESSETLWLDLEHDGLVRRVDVDPWGISWECTEYQQTKTGRWFPKRGEYRLTNKDTPYWFEVASVTMNEPFPAREFDPPPIDANTVVIDPSYLLTRIPPGRKNPMPATAPETDSPLSPIADPIVALPGSHRGLWLAVLCLSLVFVVLGWRLRCRT
jgi:hypothetical protein